MGLKLTSYLIETESPLCAAPQPEGSGLFILTTAPQPLQVEMLPGPELPRRL